MEYNGNYNTQNSLLLEKLMKYYKQNNNLTNMINIINFGYFCIYFCNRRNNI